MRAKAPQQQAASTLANDPARMDKVELEEEGKGAPFCSARTCPEVESAEVELLGALEPKLDEEALEVPRGGDVEGACIEGCALTDTAELLATCEDQAAADCEAEPLPRADCDGGAGSVGVVGSV
jgi:hypothetical protein